MEKQSKMPLLIFFLILLVIFGIGGQFAGSYLFAQLAGIKKWGFLTLWKYYHSPEYANNAAIHWRLMVGIAVAGLLSIVPFIMLIVGLITGRQKRELHGSQRFATIGEIRQKGLLPTYQEIKDGKYPYIFVGAKIGKQFIRWCSNEFMLLAARTRGGKGISTVITNCLKYAHSLVVFDPKLENYFLTSGHREKSLKQKVFLFNPAGRLPTAEDGASQEVLDKAAEMKKEDGENKLYSHRWNPYSYISRDPLFMFGDLHNMASIMYPASAKGESANSAFWIETSRNLFIGLSMYMLETEEERLKEDPTAISSLALLYKLATPIGDLSFVEWIKCKVLGQRLAKPKNEIEPEKANVSDNCAEFLADFANGNAKTGSDIMATFKAPLTIFKDPIVAAATSGDDFDLRNLRKEKMTVYLGIMPNDLERFSRLTNLFFSQLINENIKQGLPENNKSLKYQTLLLLDEFTALGALPILKKGVAYIAGYNLRMLIIFQSPQQVEDLYGREGSQVFFSNFAVQTLFGCKSQKDAEEYSALVGYETFKSKSQSRSYGKSGSRSQNISDQKRALILPDEFKTMPDDKCVVTMTGMRPIMADKIMYFKENAFKDANGKSFTEKKPTIVPMLSVTVKSKNNAASNNAKNNAAEDDLIGSNDEPVCGKAFDEVNTPNNAGEILQEVAESKNFVIFEQIAGNLFKNKAQLKQRFLQADTELATILQYPAYNDLFSKLAA